MTFLKIVTPIFFDVWRRRLLSLMSGRYLQLILICNYLIFASFLNFFCPYTVQNILFCRKSLHSSTILPKLGGNLALMKVIILRKRLVWPNFGQLISNLTEGRTSIDHFHTAKRTLWDIRQWANLLRDQGHTRTEATTRFWKKWCHFSHKDPERQKKSQRVSWAKKARQSNNAQN